MSAIARNRMKYWETIAEDLSKTGWSCQSHGDSDNRMRNQFACRLHRFKSLARDFDESAPSGFLRYYPAYRVIAWQPQGTLDDLMLDQIADWLVDIEKVFPPFKRFIDFSQLTNVAIRTSHVFNIAQRRAQQFTGVEPVRTALFSDGRIAFGIACFYESLMEDTLIEARAFYHLAWAADSLAIPVDVLTLKDKPAPHNGATSREILGNHCRQT